MASFSAEIIEKKLTLELSDKILNTLNCQEIIVDMEGSLFQFSEMINRLKSSNAAKKPLNSFVEGLDAILATAIDAVESSDKMDIDLLIAITADKSDLMKKMHKTYLTAQSDLKLAEKALFLNTINLFERIVWMLRKLGMLLEMDRI